MLTNRSIKISVVLVLLLSLLAGIALAEGDLMSSSAGVAVTKANQTTNDVLRLYGNSVVEDRSQTELLLKAAQSKLQEQQKLVQNAESFNAIREEAIKMQEEQKNDINATINALTAQNAEISKQISEDISADFSELIKLDSQYKVNLDSINRLYKELDGFTMINEIAVPDVDLSGLKTEVEEKNQQFMESANASVVGEVTNIHHPVANEFHVNSEYGTRINPVTKQGSKFHAGLDIRASYGTDVLAIFNGVVTAAGSDWSLGNYVRVTHGDGIVSLYGHLDSYSVKEGDAVSQYDVIAKSGNSGAMTTGPHLHFGLYINGMSVDPEILLGAGT